VDRSFNLTGAGTVVTGTVHAGLVRLNDRLIVSPTGLPVRVRNIHSQDRKTDVGRAGDRCALNLTGSRIGKQSIRRGDWIVAPAVHRPSTRLDCRLHVLQSEARSLRHWTPVHVHIGAADINGRVAVLEKESIAPGGSGFVQLVLEKQVPALRGDRLILRDQSALRTVAGGMVLDPAPPERGRRKPARLALLSALEQPGTAESFKRLLDLRGGIGVDPDWFGLIFNLQPAELQGLRRSIEFHVFEAGGSRLALNPYAWEALKRDVVQALAGYHRRVPNETGVTKPWLGRVLRELSPTPVIDLAIDDLIAHGEILRHGALLHLPDHVDRLPPVEENLWARLYPKIEAGGLRPPRPRELSETLREDRERIKTVLKRQAKAGKICEVSEELYYPCNTIAELGAKVEALCKQQPDNLITMRLFRAGTGIDRNVTIELLEYFDRVGLTLRVNEGRRLRGNAAMIFGARESKTSRHSRAGRSPETNDESSGVTGFPSSRE